MGWDIKEEKQFYSRVLLADVYDLLYKELQYYDFTIAKFSDLGNGAALCHCSLITTWKGMIAVIEITTLMKLTQYRII